MSIKVWPFLVSRNRSLDYRTVVAPDFICQAGISNLLARVADGDLTQPGHVFVRQVQGSKVGDFTIIFQVIEATEKDINSQDGNQVLKDSFGREIYLIEGIVFQGIGKRNIIQSDIQRAHSLVVESYKQFWNWTVPDSAIPSTAFFLTTETNSHLKFEELDPFQVKSKASETQIVKESQFRLKLTSVGFLVAVIMAVIIVGIIIRASFAPPGVSQPPKSKDEVIAVYNQQANNKHMYAEIKGKFSDKSNASGRYWIVSKEGSDFILTKDGKSFYKTGKQITTSQLVLQPGNSISRREDKSITLDRDTIKTLRKLQNDNQNAVIFLIGSVKVDPSKNCKKVINLQSNQYQTINCSGSALKMNYYPVEQAIAKLGNQVITGTIRATIIEPRPKF